jgi:hypothetical protein
LDIVEITDFLDENLRAQAELLRATALPHGWDDDFHPEAFCANGLLSALNVSLSVDAFGGRARLANVLATRRSRIAMNPNLGGDRLRCFTDDEAADEAAMSIGPDAGSLSWLPHLERDYQFWPGQDLLHMYGSDGLLIGADTELGAIL